MLKLDLQYLFDMRIEEDVALDKTVQCSYLKSDW